MEIVKLVKAMQEVSYHQKISTIMVIIQMVDRMPTKIIIMNMKSNKIMEDIKITIIKIIEQQKVKVIWILRM